MQKDPLMPDPQLLIDLVRTRMPFGKYKDRLICDLPDFYLEWHQRNGFPKGRMGMLLATMYEIRLNGLTPLLEPFRREHG